jgi:rare lipoprotein A
MSVRTFFRRALPMAALFLGCVAAPVVAEETRRIGGLNPDAEAQQGKIAVYASDLTGRRTASGVPYDPSKFTAAHANLPFGARLRVTRLDNPSSVVVTVNDRISGESGRILILSRAAAARIKLTSPSITEVRTELIGFARIENPDRKGRAKKAAATPAR